MKFFWWPLYFLISCQNPDGTGAFNPVTEALTPPAEDESFGSFPKNPNLVEPIESQARLKFTTGTSKAFGDVARGAIDVLEAEIINSGTLDATEVTMTLDDTDFFFVGGDYPGTGGTCSDYLDVDGTCTVNLFYLPLTVEAHSGTIEIAYTDENDSRTTELTLTGTGVAPEIAAVSLAQGRACILFDNGLPRCFGENTGNRLGLSADSPAEIGSGVDGAGTVAEDSEGSWGQELRVTKISVGIDHSCAVFSDGTLRCWGDNTYGQLGIGSTTAVTSAPWDLEAIDLGAEKTALDVGVGESHTCVLRSDSKVVCFGRNQVGQLGIESTDSIGDGASEMGDDLVAVMLSGEFEKIAVGANANCAIDTNDQLFCWGSGTENGNLNASGNHIGDSGGEMAGISATASVSKVWLNHLNPTEPHGCFLTVAGVLKCWGNNASGKLGLSSTITQSAPQTVTVTDSGSINYVALGFDHTCVGYGTNQVKCFGENDSGQLGQGNTSDLGDNEAASSINAISFGSGTVIGIGAGKKFSCLIFSDQAKCFGLNDHGQLGIESTDSIGDGSDEMGSNLSAVAF